MSNYVPMPSPELRAAIEWLKKMAEMQPWDSENSKNARTFLRELDMLIYGYIRFYEWERYQDFIRPRNELAQKIFTRHLPVALEKLEPGPRVPQIDEIMEGCIRMADRFLELSGEKVKNVEDIKERLREHLGWKP